MTMRVPFSYVVRSLLARRLTTALTASGMALVVYVFATVLMLAAGLRETLVTTGQPDNVVVIRQRRKTFQQVGAQRGLIRLYVLGKPLRFTPVFAKPFEGRHGGPAVKS